MITQQTVFGQRPIINNEDFDTIQDFDLRPYKNLEQEELTEFPAPDSAVDLVTLMEG